MTWKVNKVCISKRISVLFSSFVQLNLSSIIFIQLLHFQLNPQLSHVVLKLNAWSVFQLVLFRLKLVQRVELESELKLSVVEKGFKLMGFEYIKFYLSIIVTTELSLDTFLLRILFTNRFSFLFKQFPLLNRFIWFKWFKKFIQFFDAEIESIEVKFTLEESQRELE